MIYIVCTRIVYKLSAENPLQVLLNSGRHINVMNLLNMFLSTFSCDEKVSANFALPVLTSDWGQI